MNNCVSDHRSYSGRFISIFYEYVLLLRKDIPLTYPLLMAYRLEGDIQYMPGATWRDILADTMESFHAPAPLEQSYAVMEGYKRTRQQQYWGDKVR